MALLIPTLILGLPVLFFIFLWLVNLPPKLRYKQFWSPIAAIVCSIIFLWLYNEPVAFLQNMLFEAKNLVTSYLKTYIDFFSLPSSYLIFFNLLFLFLFLLIKFITQITFLILLLIKKLCIWLKKIFKRPQKSRKVTINWLSPAYFYDRDCQGVSLKRSWVFTAQYMRYVAWFSFLIFLIFMLLSQRYKISDMSLLLPHLPAIPVLVFFEIAWYLGGPRLTREQETFEGEDAFSRLKGACGDLWEEYLRIWEDRVLNAASNDNFLNSIALVGSSEPATGGGGDEDNDELQLVFEILNKQDIELDSDQLNIIKELWHNQDVMVSEKVYNKINPVLFASLQRDLLNGHKIVFLVPSGISQGQISQLQYWIKEGLEMPIFANIPFQIADFTEFYRTENILVCSIRELRQINFQNSRAWFEGVKTVVVINISEAIFTDISFAPILFHILSDLSSFELQKVLLTSDDRKNMEPFVMECLNAKPKEFHIPYKFPKEICYIIWKADGEDTFQEKKDNYSFPRYVGVEPVLAIPALEYGIEKIHYAMNDKTPWWEYIEQMDQGLDPSLKETKEVVTYLTLPYIQKPQKRAISIVHDTNCNLASAIIKAIAAGQEGVLAHVVTSPYILRDYFADNIEFFIHRARVEPTGTLSPMLMRDRYSIAFYIYERLLASELSEDDISRQINRIQFKSNDSESKKDSMPTEDQVFDLFQKTLKVDISPFLDFNARFELDIEENCFQKTNLFSIEPAIQQTKIGNLLTNYNLVDAHDNQWGYIPKDHVYQNYLPGQVHAFQGRLFRILSIDDQNQDIRVENVVPENEFEYRHLYHIDLQTANPYADSLSQEAREGYTISTKLYESRFKVQTSGYYEFTKGISFSKQGHAFFDTSQWDIPLRDYEKGRMMSFEIQNYQGLKEYDKISITLALLLKEVSVTVFPETHQYLLVTTPYVASYLKENPEDKVLSLIPNISYNTTECIETNNSSVCLIIFEDSTVDMGLIKAIYDMWESIFMILEDYLSWYLAKNAPKNDFLSYGLSSHPDWLALNETRNLLNDLLSHLPRTLREEREDFYKNQAEKEQSGHGKTLRICDFCGRPLSAMSFEVLDDGRERCEECKKTAVNKLEDLRQVYWQARNWLISKFQLTTLRKTISIKFTNAQTIQEFSGERFIPTASFDPRTVGIAVKEGEDMTIFIENGQPYHLTLATTVHELTHIWQYDHLDYNKMIEDHGLKLIEGHAKWTEIFCLKDKGIGITYRNQEKKRNDEYGQGYRMIEERLKTTANYNPFQMLAENYPV